MSIDYVLTVFITIITVVDPLGLVPFYLPIAARFDLEKQKKIIVRAFFIAMLVSTCFLFIGKFLFKYLQVDFNSLYIVGGILLFMIGLDMIYARPRKNKNSPEEQEALLSCEEVSVFPLAIPMLSGPGTIATLIMFSSHHNEAANYLVIFSAMTVAFLLAALTMRYSSKLLKIFGQVGLNVMDRVMGIILCALAVQFVTNAVVNILQRLK